MNFLRKSYDYLLTLHPNPSNRHLGFLRIAFFGLLYLTSTADYLAYFSILPSSLQCSEAMGAWLYIPLSLKQSFWLLSFYKLSLLFSAIGLFTSVAFWCSFLSFYILNFSAARFCVFNHIYYPLIIALFLWALLDNSSSLRLDHFFKKRVAEKPQLPLILFLRIHFCIVFFLSGFTKLSYSGFDWALSNNLQNMIIMQRLYFADLPTWETFYPINIFISQFALLCKVMAIGTLCFEFFAPLMLFFKRYAAFAYRALLIMQIGIVLTFFINFSSWLPLYLCWMSFKKENFKI